MSKLFTYCLSLGLIFISIKGSMVEVSNFYSGESSQSSASNENSNLEDLKKFRYRQILLKQMKMIKSKRDHVSSEISKDGKSPSFWLRGPNQKILFGRSNGSLNLYKLIKSDKSRSQSNKNYEYKNVNIEAEMEKLEAELRHGNKSVISLSTGAHIAQNYIMIFILAVADILIEDIPKAHLDKRLVMKEPTEKKILEAANEILDSGEMITSMIGASSSHALFKPVLNFLESILSNAQMSQSFKQLLMSFTGTFISFVGWEFGAQLWKEATYQVEDQIHDSKEKDYFFKDRNHIFTLLFRAAKSNLSDEESKRKREFALKVLPMLLEKIIYILTVEGSAQTQWIYNAVRHRIMNGHFYTLVSAMSLATTIGTAIIPGAGTGWGFVFGLGGGLSSIILPESFKNKLTVASKEVWSSFLSASGDEKTKNLLMAGFSTSRTGEDPISLVDDKLTFNSVALERAKYRQKIVDIYIERIYYSRNLMIDHLLDIKNYQEYLPTTKDRKGMTEKIIALQNENQSLQSVILDSLWNIISFYSAEAKSLSRLKLKQQNIESLLDLESINSESLMGHFCSFYEVMRLWDSRGIELAHANSTDVFSPSEQEIRSHCKIENIKSYESLDKLELSDRQLYDAAVRFLEKSYWTKFDETNMSVDRVKEILLFEGSLDDKELLELGELPNLED